MADLRENGKRLGILSKLFRAEGGAPQGRKPSSRARVHSANGSAMRRPTGTRAAPVGRRLERTPSPYASKRSPGPRSQSLACLPASLLAPARG